KALGLNRDLALFFELLVENDCENKRKDLKRTKARLLNALDKTTKESHGAYSIPEITMVYAALGEQEKGASLKEISQRTGLERDVILKALNVLMEIKLAQKISQNYLPLEDHVAFEGLRQNDVFKQHFHYLIDGAHRSARFNFDSDQKLFFGSSF